MLSRPVAAHTQLSLRLCMQHSKRLTPDTSLLQVLGGDFEFQPWAPPLKTVAEHVKYLELPSLSLNSTISTACMALPYLRDLVVHVGWHSEMGSLLLLTDGEDEGADERAFAWVASSQLQRITLSVPPGQSPFHLIFGDFDLFYLSDLPALQELVLRGPIVKQDTPGDDLPFMLPKQAKVRGSHVLKQFAHEVKHAPGDAASVLV